MCVRGYGTLTVISKLSFRVIKGVYIKTINGRWKEREKEKNLENIQKATRKILVDSISFSNCRTVLSIKSFFDFILSIATSKLLSCLSLSCGLVFFRGCFVKSAKGKVLVKPVVKTVTVNEGYHQPSLLHLRTPCQSTQRAVLPF